MENTTEKENRSLSPAFSPKSPPGAEDVQWCEECANVAQEICEKCKKAQCKKCHNKHIPFCERIAGMEGEPSEVTMAKIAAESSSSTSNAIGTFDIGEDVEGDWMEKLATTVVEGQGEAMAKASLALMKHSSSESATTATTVTAATATKTAQMEKDKFGKAWTKQERLASLKSLT